MNDGIVPYWSSHLDGAQSELVVPSHHSSRQNPQAVKEVRRILLLTAARPPVLNFAPSPASSF
jgi:hypothetical protein